jgi:hypothetical protein
MKYTTIISLSICLLCGCGIFELKDPASPSGDGAGDPLNIVDILKAADRNATTDIGYADYFTYDVEFVDYRLLPMYGRPVVQMLERLRSRSPQSLRVEWRFDRADSWRDGDLHYLNNVTYIVHTNTNGMPEYRGMADFRILIEDDSRISYWKDVPDGEPFFFEP